jgi:hypothetical protein
MENSYEGRFKYFVTNNLNMWEQVTEPTGQKAPINNGNRRKGFQPATADWGYRYITLLGQVLPPRITVNGNSQNRLGPTNMQASLYEYCF